MSIAEPLTDPVALARDVLRAFKNPLVITGAGVSAESGIPTFRGAGGYWRNRHYLDLANPKAFASDPRLVWDWYLERRQTVAACNPNAAHTALAEWAKRNPDAVLVTQNVDGLHERAGHPNTIRLHGSLWKNRCTSCGKERDVQDTVYEVLPTSPCCQALERPAIVWFGENISQDVIDRSSEAVAMADVLLVIGTSGAVYPAAGFVGIANSRQCIVIEVNPEISQLRANIRIPMKAGDAMPLLLAR